MFQSAGCLVNCCRLSVLGAILLTSLSNMVLHVKAVDPFHDSWTCCKDKGVSDFCGNNLCRPPSSWARFDINDSYGLALKCSKNLTTIGRCLSNGRNNSACCHSSVSNDRLSCTHLCSGAEFRGEILAAETLLEEAYSTCLILNLQSAILKCVAQGYETIPTPPVNLKVLDIGQRHCSVSWEPPRQLAHLVTSYQVHLIVGSLPDSSASAQKIALVNSQKHTFQLKDLTPNTKYAFYVVSENGAVPGAVSLPSAFGTFTTKGVIQTVQVYQSDIYADKNDTKTLICRIKVEGQMRRLLHVQWQKHREYSTFSDSTTTIPLSRSSSHFSFSAPSWSNNSSTITFEPVSDEMDKYEMNFFATQDDGSDNDNSFTNSNNVTENSIIPQLQKIYIASLHIKNLDTRRDFGTYKCVATSEYGQTYGLINVRKINFLKIPEFPPNLTECCIREGVSQACLFICKNDPDEPVTFYNIKNKSCQSHIAKIGSCSSIDDKNKKNFGFGSCCLRRRLPWSCVSSLCEQNQLQQGGLFSNTPLTKKANIALMRKLLKCKNYTSQIFDCQLEQQKLIPFPPTSLSYRVSALGSKKPTNTFTVTVSWKSSPTADLYYVYHRRIDPPPPTQEWHRTTVSVTQAILRNLSRHVTYRVVILAANMAGHSGSSRPLEFTVN